MPGSSPFSCHSHTTRGSKNPFSGQVPRTQAGQSSFKLGDTQGVSVKVPGWIFNTPLSGRSDPAITFSASGKV